MTGGRFERLYDRLTCTTNALVMKGHRTGADVLEGFAGLGVCGVESLRLGGGSAHWGPFGPVDEGGMGFPPSSDLAVSAALSPAGWSKCAFKVLAPPAAPRSLRRSTAAISQSEVSTKAHEYESTEQQTSCFQ